MTQSPYRPEFEAALRLRPRLRGDAPARLAAPDPRGGAAAEFYSTSTLTTGDFAARRAELGNPEMPRNAGRNRTPSKRALLKAIEEAGGKW